MFSKRLIAMSLAAFVAACSGGIVSTDTGANDTGVDTNIAQDTAVEDDTAADTAVVEVTEPDVAANNCEPGEGCFGEPCKTAEDCLSGICTMHQGERVCSKTCDATCPQ